jgi:hypothetical protein
MNADNVRHAANLFSESIGFFLRRVKHSFRELKEQVNTTRPPSLPVPFRAMQQSVATIGRAIDSLMHTYDDLRVSVNDYRRYDTFFEIEDASDLTLDKIFRALAHPDNQ